MEKRADNTTQPAPIVAGASQFWEGTDGNWSSFQLQVGVHPQNIRAFPATSLNFISVVPTEGCVTGGPDACADTRGGLFNSNQSLTWVANSVYNLGIEDNLGLDTNSNFGFDNVTLGWQGSGGPTTSHTIVAESADYTYMLGLLGLNPLPSNFSNFNDPQPSFLTQLRNNSLIPMLGYGYTAGAQYRNNHATFGSLVFGGYDSSRFDNSSMLTLPMAQDVQRDLVVSIQSITSGNTQLLSQGQGIFAYIDSAVSQLWLPQAVCEQFEQVYGIEWNSTFRTYTINSTQHQTNVQNNPIVTFHLGSTTTSNDTIKIDFPYAAFDKNLSFPQVKNGSIYYFPLNRSESDADITLGRTFLQEAYLITNYENNNNTLSIAPCVWPNTFNQQIRVIGDTEQKPSSSSGLSGGAIGGIAVGAVAGVALVVGAIFFFMRRSKGGFRKRKAQELDAKDTARLPTDTDNEYKDQPPDSSLVSPHGQPYPPGSHELLDSGEVHEMAAPHKVDYSELSAMNEHHPAMWKPPLDRSASELEGGSAPVYEMPGSEAYSELETPTGTGTWTSSQRSGPTSAGRPSPAQSPSPGQNTSSRERSTGGRFSWQRNNSASRR
ncbi:MAG: hypothetical protein M1820_000431 [Bogoriella megaspora]|nr:MAG: hypothetical protein M1820_000431 [Bogoriella megaspora]